MSITLRNCPPAIEFPTGITVWTLLHNKLWPVRVVGETVAYDGGPICKKSTIYIEYEHDGMQDEARRIQRWMRAAGYVQVIHMCNPGLVSDSAPVG